MQRVFPQLERGAVWEGVALTRGVTASMGGRDNELQFVLSLVGREVGRKAKSELTKQHFIQVPQL